MVHATQRFLTQDYDRIMAGIKQKINLYMQLALARARFLRNRDGDLRGGVEQIVSSWGERYYLDPSEIVQRDGNQTHHNFVYFQYH